MIMLNKSLAIVAVSGLLALTGTTFAGEMMKKDSMSEGKMMTEEKAGTMAKDTMAKDTMAKDGMAKESMEKETMMKDTMAKDDMMKKDAMGDGKMDKKM
jgi:pentapeptide MXKDX repeat protein